MLGNVDVPVSCNLYDLFVVINVGKSEVAMSKTGELLLWSVFSSVENFGISGLGVWGY